MAGRPEGTNSGAQPPVRGRKLIALPALSVVIQLAIAVADFGSYGFLVRMVQPIFGPPGPPG